MRMMNQTPNADMTMYNAFNQLGTAMFSGTNDNEYKGQDLSSYRNADNKNLTDKELYNQTFRNYNADVANQLGYNAGPNIAGQFGQAVGMQPLTNATNNSNSQFQFSNSIADGTYGQMKKPNYLGLNYDWLNGGGF